MMAASEKYASVTLCLFHLVICLEPCFGILQQRLAKLNMLAFVQRTLLQEGCTVEFVAAVSTMLRKARSSWSRSWSCRSTREVFKLPFIFVSGCSLHHLLAKVAAP